jgi:hypothetical protein
MASNEIEILEPSAKVETLKKIAAGRATDRRYFLAALGMTGAVAGAALMSGCSTSNTVASSAPTAAETNVLNFALNLEYLEATFYSYITQGTDLATALTGGGPAPTGTPGKLSFTYANAAQITDLLNEIYFDEINHVTYLRSLLGSAAVPRPAINLAAAGTITASNALSIARLFEDVGVTAYAGAAAALNTSNLTFAGQILAVESFHSGALRLVSIQNAITPTLADSLDVRPFDPGTAALAAAGPTASGGFFATSGGAIASTNTATGIAYTRNATGVSGALVPGVLAIVYGAPGAPAASGTSQGGFFPSGVNGSINTV